ncbi:MAG: dihydroorotate dehydrogenase electron transfer subunit [Thermoplasmata archaeon]|nr:dihydroorotate dehydrogenase electron transfer subunit [Thermoplasmata archaeon]
MLIRKIEKIVTESHHTKSFYFKGGFDANPGQFVMIWIPGVDEIPMGLSTIGETMGITVHSVGVATEKLHSFNEGDKIGIRGPYGNSFDIQGSKLLVIAGGTGIASLMPVVEVAVKDRDVDVAIGALTKEELLFARRVEDSGANLKLATDDGSEGFHGFVSDLAGDLLSEGDYDQMLTCGPEAMMKKVIELGREHNVRTQVSMERFMRCGIGVCGSCAFDGLRICADGPVFDGEEVYGKGDFNKHRRDPAGKRTPLIPNL